MIKYILTDIEGTTTSIEFVHDVLFPYFIKNFETFAKNHNKKINETLQNIRYLAEAENGKTINNSDIIEVVIEWARKDKKDTNLKILQGIVWREGYKSGTIKSHVYNDVPDVLKFWKAKGMELGVYSSGSVEAQKLLFAHTELGDLTPCFSHYFDTKVGAKREVKSYSNIQNVLNIPTNDILFLSDTEQELDAAQMAGFQTIQLVREGTISGTKHNTAKDFNDVATLLATSL